MKFIFVRLKIVYAFIAITLCGISTIIAAPNNSFHPIYQAYYTHLNECSIITKSNDGYMWIAHSNGIARYDGSKIKDYKQPYNFGRKIIKLSGGEMFSYINKERIEFYRYDNTLDIFTPVDTRLGNILSNKDITSYTVDDKNNLWLAMNSGIITYSGNSDEWIYFDNFRGSNILMVVSIGDNILFMTKDNIVLAYPNIKTKKLDIKYSIPTNIDFHVESALYDDIYNRVYIGTSQNGLYTFNLEDKSLESIDKINLARAPLRSLKHYNEHYLLIGTDGLGLYMADKSTFDIKYHYFKSGADQTHSIESNAIYDIYVDSQQRIYCATYAHGVLVLDPQAINYKRQSPHHPLNTAINAIYEDRDNNMWMGTNDGCYVRYSGRDDWVKINFDSSINIANRVILSFSSDGKDIYATGYGGGLLKIDRVSQTIKSVPNRGERPSPRLVFAIAYDSRGGFWLGSQSEELMYYDINRATFEAFGSTTSITSIARVSDDKFLYVENFEPFYIDSNSHEVSSFTFDEEFIEELGEYPKSVCAKVHKGIIYLATHNCGLLSYDMSTKEFTSYKYLLGSDYRSVSSLEVDSNDNIYVVTSGGVVYIDSSHSFIKNILHDSQKNYIIPSKRASLLTSEGSIIFGTQSGPLEILPSQMLAETTIVAPILNDFKIDYNSILADTTERIITEPISQIEKIELEYSQNTFSFHFSQIDFSRSEKAHFSWKLEGADERWHPITSKNSAEYNNISPGKYTFKLRVVSPHNPQNYSSRHIEVVVNSPWYWNVYSISIYIFIALALIYCGIYLYIKHLKQKQSQEKIDFFINTSHDIRTPLTLIKAPLENLRQDTALSAPSRYMLSLVTRNVDMIYDMINKLLDFEHFSTHQTEPQVQELSLNDYLRAQVDRFWEYALSRKVYIKLSLQQPNIVISICPEYLDKIIDNLLSNAIKYSKPLGEVTLLSKYDEHNLYIIVQDNGIGIPPKQQSKLFKQIYRADNAINSKQIGSGVGLLFASQLIKTMGGDISFTSIENTQTIFTVKLPLLKKRAEQTYSDPSPEPDALHEVDASLNRETTLTPILIVDDNDEILEYFTQSLASLYNVYVAESAKRAMEIVSGHHIDVVITDVMMPEVNGYELCKSIKSKNYLSHIPIIMLSALSSKEDILKGLSYGVDDYITKPFELEDLKERIATVINSRKRLSQHFASHSASGNTTANNPNLEDKVSQRYYNEVDRLFLEHIDKNIEENIANVDFNINDLCRALCVSRSVFYNRLKNLTNLTPSDMVRKKRMEYAMRLLESGGYSIRDVADMAGFSDYKYFSKVFSRYYGMLPSKINARK